MGGDEFVIVLKELSGPDAAARVAEELLREVLRPVTLAGQDVVVSASIGICLFPNDGVDAGELVRNADTAMHQSKQDGRNRVTFYARAMNEHSVARLRTENDLRQAIARQELAVHFQPQVDLATGLIVGAEALARWDRPGFGLVPPAEFIPMAEECGLISAIGGWVLDTALRQVQAWDAMGLPPITVAVNISTLEFHERGFVERIAGSIAAHGVPAARVELEITESIVLRDVEAAKRILRALHELGVKLAVDDFGTGYSSLNYLRHFSVDKLKIDKSFIDDSCDDKVVKLIRAIIAFARSLDIRTTAEGVENPQQLALLRNDGCDEVQGYIASQALPASEFEQLLRGWDPERTWVAHAQA
jgi:EAL domain-containing protein (putative c-di-GMP-specific phosphodiesterase class I)